VVSPVVIEPRDVASVQCIPTAIAAGAAAELHRSAGQAA